MNKPKMKRRSHPVYLLLLLFLVEFCSAVELPNPVKIEVDKKDGLHSLTLVNTSAVPISFKFSFTFVNARLVDPQAVLVVVPAKGKVSGPKIRRVDDSKSWRWDYESRYRIGDFRVKEVNYVFTLPWQRGKAYAVNQGFNGRVSHKGRDAYAADFDLPEGTLVTASRAGLVVSLESSTNAGGPDESYRDLANYVLLGHSDGTVTRYYHLSQGTVVVNVGDWVETGAVLGRSGNTGFSTAPHLHFDVVRPNRALEFETLPFLVWDRNDAVVPKEGLIYQHP